MRHFRSRTLVVLLILVAAGVTAQEALPQLELPQRIRISERTNISARENERYVGLLSRQVTGYLSRSGEAYTGRFFRYEQVRRDQQEVARRVDESSDQSLILTPTVLFAGPGDYPSYRDVLRTPSRPVFPGTEWEAPASVVINPLGEAEPLLLPVVVSYRYVGIESWNAGLAHRVDARFATRYPLPPSDDPDAPVVSYDGSIVRVTGSRKLTIMLPLADSTDGVVEGQMTFIRDELAERYDLAGGTSREIRGHTLLFLSGLTTASRERIARDVRESIRRSGTEEIDVEETPVGVRLTIRALRFLPDQAVLLPEERGRLQSVAAALRDVENARFLIVGHTADVGSEESQLALSFERADVIAGELAARGIESDRMDVEGRGGRDPVATNATDDGRARNRRVEIYVVEE